MGHTSGRYPPFMYYTRYKKGHILRERRPTFYRLWGALKYDTHGLHGHEPGEIREKWGRKGTPYTCFGEFQNIASHAHRLSHCMWVEQSTGKSANIPQEPKLAL